jgi:hypothetical protein
MVRAISMVTYMLLRVKWGIKGWIVGEMLAEAHVEVENDKPTLKENRPA